MKDKLTKLMEKDGFYIILFICVCVVAISAVMVSKRNLNEDNPDNLSDYEDLIIIDEKEEASLESSKMEDEIVEAEQILEEREAKENEYYESSQETMAEIGEEEIEKGNEVDLEFVEDEYTPESSEGMMAPVVGNIITHFTKDSLVYSETLEEWTAHKGIDISAKEGSPVVAALSGTISEVYDDRLWGKVIIIDHGDGLLTKYANLSTTEMVQEGAKVNKGDKISEVGSSASIEMMMEPHIHFEVIKDGVSVDPMDYIKP